MNAKRFLQKVESQQSLIISGDTVYTHTSQKDITSVADIQTITG